MSAPPPYSTAADSKAEQFQQPLPQRPQPYAPSAQPPQQYGYPPPPQPQQYQPQPAVYPQPPGCNNKMLIITLPPGSIAISMSVCLSVLCSCLKKPHVQISRNFLYMVHVVVAWSLYDENAIRYACPVLWMTPSFHIMGPVG